MGTRNIILPPSAKAAVLLDGGEIEMILAELRKSAKVEMELNPNKAKQLNMLIEKLSSTKKKFHDGWAKVLTSRLSEKEKVPGK